MSFRNPPFCFDPPQDPHDGPCEGLWGGGPCIEPPELSCGIHTEDHAWRGAQVSRSGPCSPSMLVHMFAGVFRPGWGDVFELHVVGWIDLRHIVDGGDVTSFVFTFDAFVRDDVDVVKERFVVHLRKMGVGREGLVDLGWWARKRSSDSGAGFRGPGGPGGPEIAGLAGSDGQGILES